MATDVRGRLQQGGEVRAVDYWMARALMERSRAEFAAALATVDAIVAPASPIAAPLVGSERVRVGDGEETVRGALVRLNRPVELYRFAGDVGSMRIYQGWLACGFAVDRPGL